VATADQHVTVHVTTTYEPFSDDELFNRFTHHRPTDAQVPLFHQIRTQALDYARTLVALCPPSPELHRALDHLDETVMCANAAIARNSDLPAEPTA
jgi:hypothetical protein